MAQSLKDEINLEDRQYEFISRTLAILESSVSERSCSLFSSRKLGFTDEEIAERLTRRIVQICRIKIQTGALSRVKATTEFIEDYGYSLLRESFSPFSSAVKGASRLAYRVWSLTLNALERESKHCPNASDIVLTGFGCGSATGHAEVELRDMPNWLVSRYEKVCSVHCGSGSRELSGEIIGSIRYVKWMFPHPRGVNHRLGCVASILSSLCSIGVDLLLGRWWVLLIASELTESSYLSRLDAYPKNYFHPASDYLGLPLWRRHLENRGGTYTVCLYSTNVIPPKMIGQTRSGYIPFHQYMEWSRYFVWDNQQKNWLVEMGKEDECVEVVGPIPYSDNGADVPSIGKCIAVFGVTSFDREFLEGLGIVVPYYRTEIAKHFFTDVLECARTVGVKILVKQKRPSANANDNFREFFSAFSEEEDVIEICSGVSAIRVIEKASGVISMPFTSTGLLGSFQGKPSCYFDPTEVLDPLQNAAHEVPVLSDTNSLRKWLETMI